MTIETQIANIKTNLAKSVDKREQSFMRSQLRVLEFQMMDRGRGGE